MAWNVWHWLVVALAPKSLEHQQKSDWHCPHNMASLSKIMRNRWSPHQQEVVFDDSQVPTGFNFTNFLSRESGITVGLSGRCT